MVKMDVLKITIIVLVAISLPSAVKGEETCEEINIYNVSETGYHYVVKMYSSYIGLWFRMTFWGGHLQIPFIDDVGNECFTDWGNLIVLKDRHPEITTVTESIVTLHACFINQTMICQHNVDIEMRKCGDELLYRSFWTANIWHYIWYSYICYDQIYDQPCDDEETVYFAGIEEGKYIRFPERDTPIGWFDAFHNGKQFVLPLLEQLDEVYSDCNLTRYGYFLQDHIPQLPEDRPIRVQICQSLRNYNQSDYDDYYTDITCDYFIYVRSCNGKVQFDMSFRSISICDCICFVQDNSSSSEDDKTGFSQALIICITVGSVSLVTVSGILIYIVYVKKKASKLNRIGNSFPNLQTASANIKLPKALSDKKYLPCEASLDKDRSNDNDSITVFSEMNIVGTAKPKDTGNKLTLYRTEHVEGEPETSGMEVPNEDVPLGENDYRSQSNIDLENEPHVMKVPKENVAVGENDARSQCYTDSENEHHPVLRTISVASLKLN